MYNLIVKTSDPNWNEFIPFMKEEESWFFDHKSDIPKNNMPIRIAENCEEAKELVRQWGFPRYLALGCKDDSVSTREIDFVEWLAQRILETQEDDNTEQYLSIVNYTHCCITDYRKIFAKYKIFC
jgi:hypothetical protein